MAMDIVGVIMNIVVKAVLITLGIVGIVVLVKKCISKEKRALYDWKHNILTIVCILIVAVSWFMNMGWVRLVFVIPMLLHAVAFLLINVLCGRYNKISIEIMGINILTCVTYVLANVMLPDCGDIGGAYAFFGLIRSGLALDVCEIISSVSFITNIILLIWQIVIVHKEKKKLKVNEDI